MKIEMNSHSVYQVLSDSNASARGMLRAPDRDFLQTRPGVRKRQGVPQRPDLARAPKSVYKDNLEMTVDISVIDPLIQINAIEIISVQRNNYAGSAYLVPWNRDYSSSKQ